MKYAQDSVMELSLARSG